MSNDFFGYAFALMAAHQLFETARAVLSKRVRKISFHKRFATLDDDSAGYWFATIYHLLGVFILVVMSALMFGWIAP